MEFYLGVDLVVVVVGGCVVVVVWLGCFGGGFGVCNGGVYCVVGILGLVRLGGDV